MRVGRIVAVLAVTVACGVSWVKADYDITFTRNPATGALTGNTIFRFYSRNTQTGGQTGTKSLLAYEFYMDSLSAPMLINFQDLDGDDILDANVWGVGMSSSNPTGSYFTLGSHQDVQIIDGSGGARWLSGSATVPPLVAFANRTSIEGTTVNLAQPDATQGRGLLVAVGIVPTGTEMHLYGQMAAESGPIYGGAPAGGESTGGAETTTGDLAAVLSEVGQNNAGPNYNFDIYTPEPGSLLVVGAGMVLLGIRRRRVA